MDAGSLLQIAFDDLHKELLRDVEDLGELELFWQPGKGQNHIGFLLWHLVRDEDTVVAQSVLGREEVWSASQWAARFGMDTTKQGTGFDSNELGSFRLSLPMLLDYASAVWKQTDVAVAQLPAERLGESIAWSDKLRLANLLTTGCLAHGWVHLGEIRQIRGLQGWRFRE